MGKTESIVMLMDVSGSLEENNRRIEHLYKNDHHILIGTAFNLCKDKEKAEDLVQELYLYLGEKIRTKLWWGKGFNRMYCVNFLQSRWINKVKRDSKINYKGEIGDEICDSEYDYESDEKLNNSYQSLLSELDKLRSSSIWASSGIFKMYWIDEPEETLAGISKKLKLSNSTVFLHIKKIKNHLKDNLDNPFE